MKPIRIELPTEFDVGSVNAYLFTEPEPVLVDTGVASESSWQALRAGLQAHGVAVADLQRIIITHPHVDHFAQAARLTQESDATVWIAEMSKTWLTDPKTMWQSRIDYYRDYFLPPLGLPPDMQAMVLQYFTAVKENSPAVPADRIRTFQIGDELMMGGQAWQVLHMPGHASTQTCFYQPESRQFLAADMLLPKTPTPVVERPSTGTEREPALPTYLESMASCETLEIDTVYPGHGEPFSEHRQLIASQRARIFFRRDQALELIQSGVQTPFELMNVLYASTPTQFRFAGLWMLMGYLDLLLADGLIESHLEDGVLHYTAVAPS